MKFSPSFISSIEALGFVLVLSTLCRLKVTPSLAFSCLAHISTMGDPVSYSERMDSYPFASSSMMCLLT